MIKRADKNDIPGILSLLIQVDMVHHGIRPDLFKGPAYKYTEEELAAILEDDDRAVYVFEEDGKILGHLFTVLIDDTGDNVLTDKRTLYIDDICVDESNRGRHIATSLYEKALDIARAKGCYNVTLNVWAGNDGAFEFYKKCGMKIQKYGMETIL